VTIHQLIESLPNGLHDAEIHRLSIDYTARTIECEVDIWIEDERIPGSDIDFTRSARLIFADMEYCVIEPPDPRYPYDSGQPLMVDVADIDRADNPYPEARAEGAFRCRLFVNEWNSFLTICARTADLAWLGDPHG
jgi:hypothetical protein